MTTQPRPLRRKCNAFACNNNRSASDVSCSVVHNCCGNSGYSGMLLQNSPNTARRWCQYGVICCKNGYASDMDPQKSQIVTQHCCHTSLLHDNSRFSAQRSLSASQGANYICYQSFCKCGSHGCHSSLPSGYFQHSYKCHYTCFKCYKVRHEFQQVTTETCCQSCSKCSKWEVPSPGNSQMRANNFCQSCPTIGNSVYLQLMPTVAKIVEASLPVVVQIQYAATMPAEMQSV